MTAGFTMWSVMMFDHTLAIVTLKLQGRPTVFRLSSSTSLANMSTPINVSLGIILPWVPSSLSGAKRGGMPASMIRLSGPKPLTMPHVVVLRYVHAATDMTAPLALLDVASSTVIAWLNVSKPTVKDDPSACHDVAIASVAWMLSTRANDNANLFNGTFYVGWASRRRTLASNEAQDCQGETTVSECRFVNNNNVDRTALNEAEAPIWAPTGDGCGAASTVRGAEVAFAAHVSLVQQQLIVVTRYRRSVTADVPRPLLSTRWVISSTLAAAVATQYRPNGGLETVQEPLFSQTQLATDAGTFSRLVVLLDGTDWVLGPAINGQWSSFSNFTECNTSCGYGQRCHQRSCSSPFAEQGGAQCAGDSVVCEACAVLPTHWETSAWGSCKDVSGGAVTCGIGTQSRSPNCKQCDGITLASERCSSVPLPSLQQSCSVFGPWAWKPFSSNVCTQTSCGSGYYHTDYHCWSICNNSEVAKSVCADFPVPSVPSCLSTEVTLYRPYTQVTSIGSCIQDSCNVGHQPVTLTGCRDCRGTISTTLSLCSSALPPISCNGNMETRSPFSWRVGSWFQTSGGCCKTWSRDVYCVDCQSALVSSGFCDSNAMPTSTCWMTSM